MEILLYFHLTFVYVVFINRVNAENKTSGLHNDDDVDNEESFEFLLLHGIKVETNYFQYVVSLRTAEHIKYWGDNHFCIGVIISSKSVLTAAHCVVNRKGVKMHANSVRVIAGLQNRLDKPSKGHDADVASIEVHPDYKRYEQHDIALLRLKSAFTKSRTLYEAKLQKTDIDSESAQFLECVIAGWGQIYLNGPYANQLFYKSVEFVNEQTCLSVNSAYNLKFNLCIFNGETTSDLCRGDFGAPLVCNKTLVGIFGGIQDCNNFSPIMTFTKILPYINWINKVKNGQSPHLVVSMDFTSNLLISMLLISLFV